MAPMKQTELAEPTAFHTRVPFPVIDIRASEEGDRIALGKHETDTIVVESVSELVTSSIKASLFRTQKGDASPLDIVHDANGRPMVFSVGSDGRLFCIFHVEKASRPWQLLDITPISADEGASAVVTAFDVLEVRQDLHFAVSLRYTPEGSEEIHQVFWASIKQPNAVMDDGKLMGFAASNLNWEPIQNNRGSLVITKLMNAVNPDAQPGSPPFTIFAATRSTDTHVASPYAINPSPSALAPWTLISFGAQSRAIVDMQPIVVGSASGGAKKRAALALLHNAPGQKVDIERRCHVLTLNDARDEGFGLRPLNTDKVGNPSAIWTSFNSWGSHDVLIAGNGIAFHQFQNLNDPCLDSNGEVILPHITFRQVTCKETMVANPRRYILSILAVSEDDELYLIEGDRDAANFGIPTFKCSGLPIRTNVAQIACHYNKQLDAMEFIYITKRDNQISHLARDTETGVWISTNLQVQGPGTLAKEKQFVTTITLSSKETGNPVPAGYPVSLKSEPMFVKINDLAYRLNRTRPTVVRTNAAGQIDIVTPAPDQLGISSIAVTLEKFVQTKPFSCSVDMSSRVLAMMSSIRSKEDLKSLTSPTTGEALLNGVSEDRLDASASLLSQFDTLRRGTQDSADDDSKSDSPSVGSETTLVEWDGAAQSSERSVSDQADDKSWIEKAVDVAVEFTGDALEFLRTAVKQTVKFVVIVGAKVLRVCLRIAGKVLSFVVRHTAALVRSMVGFLDDLLPINLTDLFGLHFGKHIPSIQNKLKDVTLGSLTILERFITINRSTLEDLFTDAEELMFDSVEKFREPDMPRQETAIERFVKKILNSPIVKLILKFNPLQWVLDGASEGISESFSDFKIPDTKPLADAIGLSADALFEVFMTAFGQIIDAITTSGTEALLNPKQMLSIIVSAVKKSFRTLFHATRDTVLIAVDCVARMIHAIPVLLAEPWTIPGLTDVWEDWTGQEFSLINFATYGPAILLDLMTVTVSDTQKTAVFGTPFPQGWAERFRMEPLYTSFRDKAGQEALAARYAGPSTPEDTNPIVMMVMTDYGTMQKQGEKHGAEKTTEKPGANPASTPAKDPSSIGDWITLAGGIFKLITNGFIIYQGAYPDSKIGWTMTGLKVVTALVALAAMIGEGVNYLHSSDQEANKDPRDVANTGQTVGMTAGLAVAAAGLIFEGAMDIFKELAEAEEKEGEQGQSLLGKGGRKGRGSFDNTKWDKDEEKRQNKVAHCVAGTAFNLGAAALTGFVPGCWTKPRLAEILQTGASLGGVVAIVSANYYDDTKVGEVIKWVALGTDTFLTFVGMVASLIDIFGPPPEKAS